MSSFNLNLGSNATYHVPLQEFFDDPRRRANNAAQAAEVLRAEEQPNERITWTIRLNQINAERERQLSTELWNTHSMELSRSNLGQDVVTISGIPPDNDFDEHALMVVVRTYAPNAQVV